MRIRTTGLMIGMGILMAFSQWTSAQWTQTGGPGGGSVQAFTANGSNIFAGSLNGGIFLSTNSGTSWSGVNSGLPAGSWVYSLADSGSKTFAGTNSGVYISTNNGASWAETDSGQLQTGVLSLAMQGSILFAGTDGHGVFYSTDYGASWDRVGVATPGLDTTRVFSLLVSGTNVFAGGDSGVYRSSDSIVNWTKTNSGTNSGLTNLSVRSLASTSSYFFAGTNGGGVFRSANSASPGWTAQNSGLTNSYVQSLVVSGSYIYAGTNDGGVFVSTNSGTPSWSAGNTGLPAGAYDILSLWVSGSYLYAGTLNGGIFRSAISAAPSWTAVNAGLTNTYVQSLAASGSNLFAGLKFGGGVVSYTGSTWATINPGQPTDTFDIQSLTVSGSNIYAGTDSGGVFVSTVSSTPGWTAGNSGLTNTHVQSLVVSGSNLLAGTNGGGIFESSASSTPGWTAENSGLTNMYIQSLVVNGGYIFAGTRGGGVFQSSVSGAPVWTPVNSGLTTLLITSLAVSGPNLFAGTDSGVFLSADNGASWNPVNTGLPTPFISSLAASGSVIFAGTYGDTVYLSTTSGASWSAFGHTNAAVRSLTTNGSTLYAGTGGGGVWQANISAYAYPVAPVLASPSSGSVNQPTTETLSWGSVTSATSYAVQVSTASGFGSTVFSQTGLSSPSATVNGLANYSTYYWQANAANSNGSGIWAGAWSFATIISAPGLSSPTNGTSVQQLPLALSWGSVPGATSFAVQVATASGFGSTVFGQTGLSTCSATMNSGFTNNTTYYWQASAANAGGSGAWAGAWSFTVNIAAPGAPGLSSPTNNAIDQPVTLSLDWSSVNGAVSYGVQVSTGSDFGSTIFGKTGPTMLTAVLSGLSHNTTYYWQANAANIGGSTWSGAWSFTTTDLPAPGAPGLSSPTNNAVNQPVTLTMSWGSAATATSYGVQASTDSNFGSTIFSQTDLSALSATAGGLANSTTYYWQANAANIGGTSAWSAAWTFTTIIAAPAVPQLSAPANNSALQPASLTLNWGSSAGTSGYALQVSTTSAFSSTVVSRTGLTATTFTISGLGSNIAFYWEVGAGNAGGSSGWSAVWNFTTLTNASLPIRPGWNAVSFNIRPVDSSAAAVFGDSTTIANHHNFILVKSLSGDSYWPTLKINNLGFVHTGEGYQMYSDSADTLRIAGFPITASLTPLNLGATWNMIAYLPQVTMKIDTALKGIVQQVLVVKNNAGAIFWPDYGIDNIDSMMVGQGYFAYMKSAATLIYDSILPGGSSKQLAGGHHQLLRLPNPHHYGLHGNTGNNASILATQIAMGNKAAPDSSEIAAYDANGTLVGSCTVIHGLAALTVWGKNSQTKLKDGLTPSEPITFKLWNKTGEYPVTFTASNPPASSRAGGGLSACNAQAGKVCYAAQAVFQGSFAVPEGAMIKEFNLARVYPNPFRGAVNVAFDVPTINGVSEHTIEINIFNIKGSLVHQIAKGKYLAGHYVVSWGGESSAHGMIGSGIYVIQMKANNFDKRLKLVRVP